MWPFIEKFSATVGKATHTWLRAVIKKQTAQKEI